MKDCVKYIKVGDAVKILCHDCIRYVFPTTAEPTTEFIKLDNAIDLLQLYPSTDVKPEVRLYPSADVVPVVRCKNCKWNGGTIGQSWCDFHEFTILSDDDYCSYGERKDDDGQR